MAGFFSLGSATYHSQQQNPNTNLNLPSNPTSNSNPIESSTWFLYNTSKNTTTTQQQPPSMGGGGDSRLINFSDESTWVGGSAAFDMTGHSGGTSGSISCQDCGNQAKKDCPHMRCRTCCKSRGFHCQTHVKSTWVSAAKRRERQQDQNQNHQHSSRIGSNTKRTRSLQDHDHNHNMVNPVGAIKTTFAYNSSSELEIGNFPSEVTTPANFRCVKVSSIDETDDQFAYQAAVNISGHLFKGILYDQGPEGKYMGGDTSSGGSVGIPQLNLSTTSPGNSTATANFISHSLYPFLGGNDYTTSTQFFHQISRD